MSELDMLYLKKDSKLGEEGPDLLPDLVPNNFTEEKAVTFRNDLGLAACGEEDSLLDRTWRLSEALKEAELVSQDWKGEDRRKLLQLLLEFADVFCVDKRDLKRAAHAEQMVLDTKGSPPIRQRPYKLGPKETEVMEKEVAGQLEAGVAVKSKSAWASPAFIVWRK